MSAGRTTASAAGSGSGAAVEREFAAPERIAALVEALEAFDGTRLAPARELVEAVLMLHGAGLAAIVDTIRRCDHGDGGGHGRGGSDAPGSTGRSILGAIAADPDAAALLLLHGLHPDPLPVRIARALEGIDDASASGVRVRLVDVDGDVARLALDGNGANGANGSNGAGRASLPELKARVEAAVLERAPEIASIEFQGMPAAGEVAFIPLSALKKGSGGNAFAA